MCVWIHRLLDKWPHRTRDYWGKPTDPARNPGKPRAGHEQANSGSICSKFLSFALRFSASRRGVPQGLSQDFRTPRIRSLRIAQVPAPGGSGGGEAVRAGARSLPARWKPASPSPQPRLRPQGPAPGKPKPRVCPRGRSSPRQVPQGHACPGGCKPQAKVEKGWSFASNPFYTVKTAKLSPSRPLFNWEANRRKTKTNARADFLSLFFLLNEEPILWWRGKRIRAHVCSLWGLDWRRPQREGWPGPVPLPTLSPHLRVLHANPVSPRVTLGPNAPGKSHPALSRWGRRADRWGCWGTGSSKQWINPGPRFPGRQAREEEGFGPPVRGLGDPKKPLQPRGFPWGKADFGRQTAPRLSRFSTCREPCRGCSAPGGGLREIGVGVQGALPVKWAGFRRASVTLSRWHVKKGPSWKITTLLSWSYKQGRKAKERRQTLLKKKKKKKTWGNGVVRWWRGRKARKDSEGFPSLFFKSPALFF